MPATIATLERSVYEAIDDEAIRAVVDTFQLQLANQANWKVRKRSLLDFIMALQLLFHGALDEKSQQEEDFPEDYDPEEVFVQSLPLFVGAILEGLEETRVGSVEQAAFYLLSAHPEHQDAAMDWFDQDYRHDKAMKKFLRANRYYREVVELGQELAGGPFDLA